jgi:hypothetical protein
MNDSPCAACSTNLESWVFASWILMVSIAASQ